VRANSCSDPAAPRETITPAFAHAIANVPDKTHTALVVAYPPGGKTPPHRHGQAFVVGYVLEGVIRSRIDSGKEQVFHAGESWTEKPGVHHVGDMCRRFAALGWPPPFDEMSPQQYWRQQNADERRTE